MEGLQIADYVVVLIYALVVVGIGFYFSRKQHDTEDFFFWVGVKYRGSRRD